MDNALDLGDLLAKINVPNGQAPYGYKTYDIEIEDTDNAKGVVSRLIDFVRTNKNGCERFKDENGKVGGRIIIHQGGACGLSNVPNVSKSGSCGSSNVASKASSCGVSANTTYHYQRNANRS